MVSTKYVGDQKVAVPPGDSARSLRRALIKEHHDIPLAGHQGFDRTKASLARCFWWPGLHKEVLEYCKACAKCQANKASTKKPYGAYQPLPVPPHPWHTITMDFITGLPQTVSGLDTIAVFVDKLTKLVHLYPCTDRGLTA